MALAVGRTPLANSTVNAMYSNDGPRLPPAAPKDTRTPLQRDDGIGR